MGEHRFDSLIAGISPDWCVACVLFEQAESSRSATRLRSRMNRVPGCLWDQLAN
jgi:hypothetical protein